MTKKLNDTKDKIHDERTSVKKLDKRVDHLMEKVKAYEQTISQMDSENSGLQIMLNDLLRAELS